MIVASNPCIQISSPRMEQLKARLQTEADSLITAMEDVVHSVRSPGDRDRRYGTVGMKIHFPTTGKSKTVQVSFSSPQPRAGLADVSSAQMQDEFQKLSFHQTDGLQVFHSDDKLRVTRHAHTGALFIEDLSLDSHVS